MASSPPNLTHDEGQAAATDSSVGFALQELAACWNQAHEAMSRGDLKSVMLLLSQAEEHLLSAGDSSNDTPDENAQRRRAAVAFGLLEHAMEAGLTGLRQEIGQTRRGAKALRGYGHAAGKSTKQLLKSC